MNFFKYTLKETRRVIYIMLDEFRLILKDSGLVVIFIGATLLYPLVYSSIYRNETVRDMPIAVVDESNSTLSRELIRRIDATPDLKVVNRLSNLEEVKDPFYRQKIHGVFYIPRDFSEKINRNEQATVSVYCDMSSFMYYRTMLMGTNFTVLDMGDKIKLQRLSAQGITGETSQTSIAPFTNEGTIFYNESMGFGSFLLPAVLILILHQTLFFGITMIAGTAREENRIHSVMKTHSKAKFVQNMLGKALCYFSLYMVIAAYVLLLIPRLFQLPHLGNPLTIMQFIIPFLFAVIFFSMTVSVFIRNRETGMGVFLFFSVILLFLSGISWPQSNINWFWRTFASFFPSTYGIQGFVKINSMGADLSLVKTESVALWIQTIVYFITTLIVYRMQQTREKISEENGL